MQLPLDNCKNGCIFAAGNKTQQYDNNRNRHLVSYHSLLCWDFFFLNILFSWFNIFLVIHFVFIDVRYAREKKAARLGSLFVVKDINVIDDSV